MKYPSLFHSNFKPSTLIALVLSVSQISCVGGGSSDDPKSSADSSGNQSGWNPDYPGIFYGCEIPDAEDRASAQCFNQVYPLPDDPTTFVKSCDEGEVLHEDGCPSILNSETGGVIATCQESANPNSNTGFVHYEVFVVYENELLQSARDAASASETAQEACERLKDEFAGTLCPSDGVITDLGYSTIDCSQLDY